MIGNKSADEIIKLSKTQPQNSSWTVTKETENNTLGREIPKDIYIYIFLEKKIGNYWWSKKIHEKMKNLSHYTPKQPIKDRTTLSWNKWWFKWNV